MSDVKLTAELDAKGVVRGVNQTKKATDDLKKSSGSLGQGMLAVSQGFEDFAMAGIKGVLNNIPQAISMFGGSSGLAAGASIAAVSIYVLTDRIFAMLDAMQEAKLAEFAKATFIDVSGFEARKKAIESTSKALQNYISVSNSAMSKQMANVELNASNFARLSESSRRLKLESDILAVKKSSLSEDQKQAQIKKLSYDAEITAMNEKVSLSEYVAKFASMDSDARKIAADQTKSALEAEKQRLASIEANLKASTNERIMNERKRRKDAENQFRQPEGAAFYMDADGNIRYGKQSWAQEREKIINSKRASVTNQINEINKLRNAAKPQIENSNKQIGALQEQLKALEEVSKMSDEERQKRIGSLEILRAETELNKQTLKIKQDQAAADDLAKRQQEVPNAAKAMMSNDAITSSGLLSSLGRVGGSAREAVSALGAINIQKQQLSTLKIIARNTAKRTVATAG